MKLTLEKAKELLEEARKKSTDDRWINHSICVGDTAGKIAEKLNLDVNYAKTLGYIHDIGRGIGDSKDHVMNGYYYLKELGYDDEYANICLTHSYLNNDIYCTAGGIPTDIPFRTEFIKNHEYTSRKPMIFPPPATMSVIIRNGRPFRLLFCSACCLSAVVVCPPPAPSRSSASSYCLS